MQPLILVKKILIYMVKFIPINISLPILIGPLKGFKWITGAAAGPAKGVAPILNLTESSQLNLAKDLIPKNGISFDIGANVGLYTLLFSRYSKKVYAFEPLYRNIEYLYQVLKINNVVNVEILHLAVSDFNGDMFFREGSNIALGKLNESGKIIVSVISLDSFIFNRRIYPDVLKVDVEGSELSVLKGAKEYLKKFNPIIFLSTHSEKLKKDCIHFLVNLDYVVNPINANDIEKANEFFIIKKPIFSNQNQQIPWKFS